jgi:hypothetical protein
LQADERPWLVEGILRAGHFTVMGGPEKTLKTNLAVDLSVSLASGTPFLGSFAVPQAVPVLYYSAESAEMEVRSMLDRMRRARDLEPYPPEEEDRLAFCFTSVPFGHEGIDQMMAVAIEKHQAKVLVIDPIYLSLPVGGDSELRAENMFNMGPRLNRIMPACRRTGCTPILLHHSKAIQLGRLPQLSDLQYAGFKQIAGQWVLVNRRKPGYKHDGRHNLVMVAGARSGHSLAVDLEVNEGLRDNRLTGWHVTVLDRGPEAEGSGQTRRTNKGQEKAGASSRVERDAQRVKEALKKLRANYPGGRVPRQKVKKETGINSGSALTKAITYGAKQSPAWFKERGKCPKTVELLPAGE